MSTLELQKKLSLIEWLAQVHDISVLSKIDAIRKQNRISSYESELKPMSAKTLISRAKKANDDIKKGKVITSEQLEKRSEKW